MKHELTEKHQPKAIKEIIKNKIKNRITRQSQDISCVHPEMNQCLIYELAKVWNNSSMEVKNSGNLYALKKQLTNSALQSLQHVKKSTAQKQSPKAMNGEYKNIQKGLTRNISTYFQLSSKPDFTLLSYHLPLPVFPHIPLYQQVVEFHCSSACLSFYYKIVECKS